MPDTPYCPLLSINKDVPVLCQEELCMWYVKQLKLCSATVLAYTNALNLQTPTTSIQTPQPGPQPTTSSQKPQPTKQNLSNQPRKEEIKTNPFILDDLD